MATLSYNLVPLQYLGCHVGFAKIDAGLNICPTINWRLDLPPSLRRPGVYTPDVLLAMLREDDHVRRKCHPFWMTHTFGSLIVRLNRLVLRPDLIPQFNTLIATPRGSLNKELLHHDLKRELQTVRRVHFHNRDCTDCRRENLTELLVQPASFDEPSLIHEDLA